MALSPGVTQRQPRTQSWRSVARRAKLVVLLAALLDACAISASVSHAAPSPKKTVAAKIDDYLKRLTKRGQFSGTVLVIRSDKPLVRKGYGFANWNEHLRNKPATRFRLASVTKQFTALAILLLQERGKLSVHDPMCKYVDNCPEAWKPITIHQLLTHTSGIPDVLYGEVPGFVFTDPYTPQQVIDLARDVPLVSAPGEYFHYSSTGYIILGYIIEKVSGEPYATFLEETILRPLGMPNTGVTQDGVVVRNLAVGYSDQLHVPATVFDGTTAYSAAGLYSTVDDLATWDRAVETPKLFSQTVLDAMFTVYWPPGAPGGYGYGWWVANVPGHRMMWHDGSYPGVATINLLLPDDRLTIIVLSNYTITDAYDVAAHLLAMVLGPKLLVPARAIDSVKAPVRRTYAAYDTVHSAHLRPPGPTKALSAGAGRALATDSGSW